MIRNTAVGDYCHVKISHVEQIVKHERVGSYRFLLPTSAMHAPLRNTPYAGSKKLKMFSFGCSASINTKVCRHWTSAVSKSGPKHATITYRGRRIRAESGELLRNVLLRNGIVPHNGGTLITCRGLGTCGTCAVSLVEGLVEPPIPSTREKLRLRCPPHTKQNSENHALRLACQVRMHQDIKVEKYDGFWGHGQNVLEHIDIK